MTDRVLFRNPSDQEYFEYLAGMVFDVDSDIPSQTYWCMLGQLHKTPYVWYIPNDDNRAMDGKDFRYEFEPTSTQGWLYNEPCSFLEMLLGVARRMDFLLGEDLEGVKNYVGYYARELLRNCQLLHISDAEWTDESEAEIDAVLERIMEHKYNYRGQGGLFPIAKPVGRDMRAVEIWDQLCAYIEDRT